MVALVMGVAGSGKTLIGEKLAAELGWEFADADTFHPAENVAKMSRGVPLTDADREPWLRALRQQIEIWKRSGKNGVLACSALKQKYRDQLSDGCEVKVVYLRGTFEVIHGRLAARAQHFMKPGMLASQFSDLEEPADAIVADVAGSPEDIVSDIQQRLAECRKRGESRSGDGG